MSKKITNPIVVGIISVFVIEFIILPGYHSPDIGVRILTTLLIALLSVMVIFYFYRLLTNRNIDIPEGETEIDYIPLDELKTKKRKKRDIYKHEKSN